VDTRCPSSVLLFVSDATQDPVLDGVWRGSSLPNGLGDVGPKDRQWLHAIRRSLNLVDIFLGISSTNDDERHICPRVLLHVGAQTRRGRCGLALQQAWDLRNRGLDRGADVYDWTSLRSLRLEIFRVCNLDEP
jgi:hypothetical protein